MKNYEKSGDTFDYINGVTAVSSGDFVKISGVIGCAVNDIAASATGPVMVLGRFTGVAKTTGETWDQGTAIYWKESTSKFTTTSSGNTLAGRSTSVEIAGATTGDISLNLN